MPTYKVISRGFFDGRMYDPEGKRSILHTDKPFSKKEIPSWLTPIPKESDAVKAKRKSQEVSQASADVEKSKQDKMDIANASTVGDGAESSFITRLPGSVVETL